ncbi:ABC transporter ATP-binding protein [Turicibacter bilis]|uniref:ABC transporter ATP-binding protein n=1 Tax=Turicibacter bilis TaxID=2735723 RepID=A0ABY5JNN4_9FIRM|nr:ABC transporter ATP-binding protein [Turicibacter bilis]MBS3200971.1 ABC transporter ATP-binding protein [Turicibacter bilis]UUF07147.1 ABC transporter ATP-binding protein [Turicibacter bilis]
MDSIIKIEHMDKVYKMYASNTDRLKEALHPFKKKYSHAHYALKDINLEIKQGESVGLLGTNGSGKSTLLKIITGVLTPSNGKVVVDGKVSALLELGAGFNPEYTGLENIYLNGSMMGYTREEIDQKVNGIIDFADIGEFIHQPVKTYSSGMFARLAFSVAISVEPEILIVDEALSVGDSKFQIKCIEKMEQIKSQGTTVLFVSHGIEQIRRFCDRAVWIEKGNLKAAGPVNDICDLYENYLIYGEQIEEQIEEQVPQNQPVDILGRIKSINLNKEKIKSFEELRVEIEYDIYVDEISNFLIGVAFYTPDREYIFGPNTFLDGVEIPNTLGTHKVQYIIKKLPLLNGIYQIDVGIFSQKGLVCIDYKGESKSFMVGNDYISEGKFYIEHEWEI